MIGCVLVAYLADKLCCVRAMQAICLVSLIGAVVQGTAMHIGTFLLGRTLGGMGAA